MRVGVLGYQKKWNNEVIVLTNVWACRVCETSRNLYYL